MTARKTVQKTTATKATATKAVLTPEQLEQAKMAKICEGLPTKSAKIRALNAKGYTRSQIKDHLGILYQHVRNVLITPLTGKPAAQ
jgi:hypothetical protein